MGSAAAGSTRVLSHGDAFARPHAASAMGVGSRAPRSWPPCRFHASVRGWSLPRHDRIGTERRADLKSGVAPERAAASQSGRPSRDGRGEADASPNWRLDGSHRSDPRPGKGCTSIQIRCRITASLGPSRACHRSRWASGTAQAFSGDHRVTLVSKTSAASYSSTDHRVARLGDPAVPVRCPTGRGGLRSGARKPSAQTHSGDSTWRGSGRRVWSR